MTNLNLSQFQATLLQAMIEKARTPQIASQKMDGQGEISFDNPKSKDFKDIYRLMLEMNRTSFFNLSAI